MGNIPKLFPAGDSWTETFKDGLERLLVISVLSLELIHALQLEESWFSSDLTSVIIYKCEMFLK